jgi:hypothetical protein
MNSIPNVLNAIEEILFEKEDTYNRATSGASTKVSDIGIREILMVLAKISEINLKETNS